MHKSANAVALLCGLPTHKPILFYYFIFHLDKSAGSRKRTREKNDEIPTNAYYVSFLDEITDFFFLLLLLLLSRLVSGRGFPNCAHVLSICWCRTQRLFLSFSPLVGISGHGYSSIVTDAGSQQPTANLLRTFFSLLFPLKRTQHFSFYSTLLFSAFVSLTHVRLFPLHFIWHLISIYI